jgi:hypothetical protein
MRRAFLPLLLALAACQGEGGGQDAAADETNAAAETPAVAPPAQPPLAEPAASGTAAPLVALDGEGLRLVLQNGATRLLAFGAPRAQAEQAVGAALGRAERSANSECGAGPLDFTRYGPLQLVFQDGAFAGWVVDRAGSLSTIDGVAIGSRAAQVQDARTLERVPGSTLGEEFRLGGGGTGAIGGFFDGAGADARVTQLFAGTTCFFR